MDRPSKSAAETAEKLSIICGLPTPATCAVRRGATVSSEPWLTPLKTPLTDAAAPPGIVLDTNVVFDWLLFCNPECEPLSAWLQAGKACWLVSAAMRDEMLHVLGRGRLHKWHAREAALWAGWERWSCPIDAPAPGSLAARLRCTDADDQKFIDLALACNARWLLSRDRAVLKLARRARAQGLTIQTPGAWATANVTG